MGKYVYKIAWEGEYEGEFKSFFVTLPEFVVTYRLGEYTAPNLHSGPLFCFEKLTWALKYLRSFRYTLEQEWPVRKVYLLKGYAPFVYDFTMTSYYTEFAFEQQPSIWETAKRTINNYECSVKETCWADSFRPERAYRIHMM